MRKMKSATIIVAFILFVKGGSEALPNQDIAKDLLEKVSETYKSSSSYHFEGTVTSETKSPVVQSKIEAPFVLAAIKPDRIRVEVKSPAMGLEILSITSGRTTWEYLFPQRQFTKKESKATYAENELYSRMWAVALGVMLPQFEYTERLVKAKILSEESVEISNTSRSCYVIEAEYDSSDSRPSGGTSHKTLWVDKERYVVLKEVATNKMTWAALGGPAEMIFVTTFNVSKLNEPLPDALFIFTPPDGAKEVKQFNAPQKRKTN